VALHLIALAEVRTPVTIRRRPRLVSVGYQLADVASPTTPPGTRRWRFRPIAVTNSCDADWEKRVWRRSLWGSWFTSGVIAGTMVLVSTGARWILQGIVVVWSHRADDAGRRHALAILRLFRSSQPQR
jgi:hypothetical protein